MPGLPVILHLDGRNCLIVGGGGVAARRAQALLDAGATVRVVAPRIDPAIRELPRELSLDIQSRKYESADLTGVYLVVIATDDDATNAQVADDAIARGVLVNRTDDPASGDLSIPAHARHGPITLAVDTGGISAAAAATIRRELSAALDPVWPAMLAVAAGYRDRIKNATNAGTDRLRSLKRLTDAAAIAEFRQGGEAALRRYYDSLLDPIASVNDKHTDSDSDSDTQAHA